jgi:Tfp pilus assembly protein PilF
MNNRRALLLTLGFIILLLSACAGSPTTEKNELRIRTEQDAHRATTSLLAKADTQEKAKHWEQAAALLERALRIDPRNAHLWHRLATVRFQQGQYRLAESLAQKSNALAPDDVELQQENLRLMDEARSFTREAPL